ncbi:PBP1A family penicillin-binding protein [Paenibacillus hunanensis]|uniref:transglycosylase domain-containing protein n=1 Tax=Paenibacillus hunanensis TaxID=539262 RepID=UPI002026720C|nr:PBP1A family penicillin-binding protein [Paenibacillus hunanensis]MCL9662981.1 PBP1A family penicillin-binding protein [Paenibacillus hunanensis]
MPRQQLSRSDRSQPSRPTTTRPARPNRNSTSGSGGGGNGGGNGGKKKKKRITGKKVFWTLFGVTALGIFCALAAYLFIMVSGEKIYEENINKLAVSEPTKVYDRNGTLILQRSVRTGDPVKYEDIPKEVVEAFVATEDRRFFDHQGVDLWSIGRAAVRDVIARSAVEGGSTITQQLAKNVFLNTDKTFFRKATEVSIALAIERKMTKEAIITTYLNRIYFGSGAYGIKEAAETYFGVSDLSKLKLWQIATLAGLPKAPSRYSPLSNPDLSQQRRAVVLQLMQQQGYITAAQEKEAESVVYDYQPPKKESQYDAFIEYAMQEAEDETGLSADDLNRGGYNIYTTMDAKAQKTLEDAFNNDELFEKSSDDVKVQGSMVIVNNDTGGIVALLGGRDYKAGNFSRVTSHRQPGSAFKPIISYAPALQSGNYNSNSMLNNEKQCFGSYCPNNLHGGYSSSISMTAALEDSVNIPAVWLLNQIGIDAGINYAKSVGFNLTADDRNLAIALGGLSKGTNTLEMAQAYRVFADGGTYMPAYAVKSISDSTGAEVYKNDMKSTQVLNKQATDEMTQMLQNVVQNGTGKRAQINRPVAGKTGTTQHGISGLRSSANRDIWFAGYTKEWTAAIWMGYDQPDRNHLLKDGSGRAAAMFAAVMGPALEGYPVQNFDAPDEVAPPPVEETPEEQPQQPPAAVTGLSASFDQNSQAVALSWKAVEGATSYTVYRKESTATEFNAIANGVSGNAATDAAVTPGATYEYYVTAVTADGAQSDASNTARITIEQASPEQTDNPDGVVPPGGEPSTPPTGEENGPGSGNGPGNGPGNGNGNQGNGNGNGGPATGPGSGSTDTGTGTTDGGQTGTDSGAQTDNGGAAPGTTTPGTTPPSSDGTDSTTTSPDGTTTAPPSTP